MWTQWHLFTILFFTFDSYIYALVGQPFHYFVLNDMTKDVSLFFIKMQGLKGDEPRCTSRRSDWKKKKRGTPLYCHVSFSTFSETTVWKLNFLYCISFTWWFFFGDCTQSRSGCFTGLTWTFIRPSRGCLTQVSSWKSRWERHPVGTYLPKFGKNHK